MPKKRYPRRKFKGRMPVLDLGETVRIKDDVGHDLTGKIVGGRHPNYVVEIPRTKGKPKMRVQLEKKKPKPRKRKEKSIFDLF